MSLTPLHGVRLFLAAQRFNLIRYLVLPVPMGHCSRRVEGFGSELKTSVHF